MYVLVAAAHAVRQDPGGVLEAQARGARGGVRGKRRRDGAGEALGAPLPAPPRALRLWAHRQNKLLNVFIAPSISRSLLAAAVPRPCRGRVAAVSKPCPGARLDAQFRRAYI